MSEEYKGFEEFGKFCRALEGKVFKPYPDGLPLGEVICDLPREMELHVSGECRGGKCSLTVEYHGYDRNKEWRDIYFDVELENMELSIESSIDNKLVLNGGEGFKFDYHAVGIKGIAIKRPDKLELSGRKIRRKPEIYEGGRPEYEKEEWRRRGIPYPPV